MQLGGAKRRKSAKRIKRKMRKRNNFIGVIPLLLLFIIFTMLLLSPVSAGSGGTEGGNISSENLSYAQQTFHWASVVGWMNISVTPNVTYPIGFVNATNATVYVTYTNGSFANQTAILTRLSTRPAPGDFFSPTAADFNNGGMFDNFTTFLGFNFTSLVDSPLNTFCNPACVYRTCNITGLEILCPYIILNPNINLSVLKFNNGSMIEPIFVATLGPEVGYNTTIFDFQYMMPANDSYFFYVYPECIIDPYIDGVNTIYFPNTGVPYDVRFVVRDKGTGAVIPNVELHVSENNGRNILFPILTPNEYVQRAYAVTDGSGQALYAIAPTRYNIPDSYNYDIYVEVTSPIYCIKHLNITNYGSLAPTYRTSLVDPTYASQVKSSVQNMNALAATATKWITAKKMKDYAVNASENGTITAIPTLKAGAPNKINITALNDSGDPFTADITIREDDGFIIVVPQQPDKNYSNYVLLNTSQPLLVIPTRYNNNANLTVRLYKNFTEFAAVSFPVDTLLEPPQATETNMDDATYSLIASSLQNINMVLANMGASISTI